MLSEDEDLLVVDKPAGLVVHGGDERVAADLVTRLRARLEQAGKSGYLSVHQRLDQDASGAIAFVRKKELARRVASDFEGHLAKRSYVAAVVLGDRDAPDGVLEHRLAPADDGRMQVVPRGGKLARSRVRVLETHGARALVELGLETGLTHQLRVQLAHQKLPIAGDLSYGGPRAERLLLHAVELELPSLGRRFSAPIPAAFVRWLAGGAPSLPSGSALKRALSDAGARRWPLRDLATAFRLVNELGDELPGVTVDRYGDYAVLETSSDGAHEHSGELSRLLVELGARGVYHKLRFKAGGPLKSVAPAAPLAGEPAPASHLVREADLSFEVALAEGLGVGLYVDQRQGRQRVRQFARGGRVLNLFCHTGAFSVAAAAGGAKETVSVDVSAHALERARRNLEHNSLSGPQHRLLREDALKWVARARRRRERFELIVLDPPTFASSGRGRNFSVERDYVGAARDALAILSPGGRLFAVVNHRGTSQAALRRMLHEAARQAGRKVQQMKDIAPAFDCPPVYGEPYPSRSVLLSVA